MPETVFERAVRELGKRVRISGDGTIELNGRVIEHDYELVDNARVIIRSKAEKVVSAWAKMKKRSRLAHFPRNGMA